jgi:acyl-[acyl-carrier-protein]-phospholipid O-acyltransferase/long-chain-fatty-acid--[acyl-carrier-protein] ligase
MNSRRCLGPIGDTFLRALTMDAGSLGLLGALDEAFPLWGTLGAVALALLLAYFFRYHLLVRVPLWILRHTLYRLRVYGAENVPATGPALLVCNHVSHIDALLVLTAQRRHIRFVIWAPFLRVPGLRWLLRWAKVIPIDSSSGPRAIVHSLRTASDALARGEVVCIFAEGGITRTGFLLPFNRGFEQIAKHNPAPIIPVCLDHLWGSIFSYEGNRFFWKWPQRIPYPVCVAFGPPLAATSSAFEVRQAIQKLSADCSIRRADWRRPVHRQFVRIAVRHPLRPCFIDPNNTTKPMLRYVEALAAAKIFARLLRPVLADDKMVGLWLPPSMGGALTNIALSLLGKVGVNLNYTSSPAVVQSTVRQCNIRRVLTSRRFVEKVPLDVEPQTEVIYLEDYRPRVTRWKRLRALLSVLLLPGFVQERWVLGLGKHTIDDLATVIFSSGSTGEPKGVMLTHGNIAANAESMVQAIKLRPSDRLLAILPPFHSFGYTVCLWVPLQEGASTVFHPNPLQAKEIGELCKKYRCSIFLSTPTFLRSYLRRCETDDFKLLRLLVCGAEKLPRSLAQEFKEKFGIEPLEGYGCTELSPAAASNVPDWQEGNVRQVGNRPGTIGLPIPGVAARVVDPDTLAPKTPGEEGLLLVYGANVMKGYLNRPEATGDVIRDGWYVTGDIARIDEDGFITITDRQSRFSKVGGEMVPHQKIEDELHSILGTTERTVVVTAVPDESKGERLIVLHLPLNGRNARELWQKLNGQGLPNLWVPRERDFYQIPEVPVLGSGKVDLKRVKELALEKTKA